MKKLTSLFALCALLLCSCSAEGSYTLTSPNGKITTTVAVGGSTTFSVALDGKTLIQPSTVALRLDDGTLIGSGKARKVTQYSHNGTIATPLYFRSSIEDNYNAIEVVFADHSAVEFRAYDSGVVYRFTTSRKESFKVQSEVAAFDFGKPYNCWIAYNNLTGTKKDKYFTSFEQRYNYLPINQIDPERLAFNPVVVDVEDVNNLSLGDKILYENCNLQLKYDKYSLDGY